MKRYFFLFFLFFFSFEVSAQKDFEQKVAKIVTYLERNIQAGDVKDTGKPIDFFLYDISLGKGGEISTIHILMMDSLSSLSQIKSIALYIKSNYIFPNSKFKKIFIPVLIIHSGNDEEPSIDDKDILETLGFFELLSKKNKGTTFISKYATINRIE